MSQYGSVPPVSNENAVHHDQPFLSILVKMLSSDLPPVPQDVCVTAGTSTFHNLFCRRGPSVQAVTASGWAFADASWYIHYTQSLLELLVYGGYKTPLPELVDYHSPQFPQLSDLAVGLFYSCSLQFLFQVFQPTKTPVLVRFPPGGYSLGGDVPLVPWNP